MGLFNWLYRNTMLDFSLSPEQLIELLPTMAMLTTPYPIGSENEKTLKTMTKASIEFGRLPYNVQPETLRNGLNHKEKRVREACAERLKIII